MRVLLDECLPKKFKNEFYGHEIFTVPEAGWAGKKNGQLLRLAAAEFDVFITMDQNLHYQQVLSNKNIAVIILQSQSNRYEDLKTIVPQVKLVLHNATPGSVTIVKNH